MESKKINQLATNVAPVSTDLTIIGDPITGVSKKITLLQLASIFSGSIAFYTNYAAFPATGTVNTIYCAKDTNKLYLWSGSAYVETFPSQALLDTYQLRSEKGVSNGYASLDSAGKVPISQLPSSIMEYKGMWSATTNTPTLANGTGDTGDVYICNGAGSVNFGAGAITFAVGDYVVYSGTIWQRSSGAVGTVTSVGLSTNGNSITIGSSPISTSGTITANFAGTSLQYINGAGNLTTFPILTGYVTAVSGTAPVVSSGGTTPAISMAAATALVDGYLSAANFVTFNNKQNVITLTTTGTSGASTLIGATLNIPNYGSALTGYVPYTGATQDVDLGAFKLNAQSLHAKGTGGLGHLGLKHQSASATALANEVSLFADSLGDLSWLNGNLYLSKFITSGNTAARSYTFPNANGTVALLSSLSATSPIFYNSTTGVISSQAASATLEGYVTTGTQTIAGSKAFSDPISANYGIALLNSFIPPLTSINYAALSGNSTGLSISYRTGAGTTYTNNLNFPASNNSYAFPSASGTIALVGGSGVGTVTSVAALTLGTTGTDLSSTVANGTTTPVITLNVPTASATNRGALSSADWSTFNGKYNLPSLTSGSVLFSNGTTISQNNSNFFWDNTNVRLGIGTASPSAGVTVYSTTAATQFKAAGVAPAFTFSDTLVSSTYACVFGLATSANHFVTGTAAGDMAIANQSTSAGAIVFGTGTTEKMRMTSTGKLSIGNTNDTYTLDVSGTGRFTSTLLVSGASTFGDSVTITAGNSYANYAFKVNNAAGAEKLRLDGNGNLLVGYTTDQGYKFGVNGTSIFASAALFQSNVSVNGSAIATSGILTVKTDTSSIGATTALGLLISNDGGIGKMAQIGFGYSESKSGAVIGGIITNGGGSTSSALFFATRDTTDGTTAPTERMRITSGGNVSIGNTIDAGFRLYVKHPTGGEYIEAGTTSAHSSFQVNDFTGGNTYLKVRGDGWIYIPAITDGAGSYALKWRSGGLLSFDTSSARYKDNIRDSNYGLSDVMKLRSAMFEYKKDVRTDIGLIAEEVYEVIPELVTLNEDGLPDAVSYDRFVSVLIKSIQEQQIQIQSLQEQINILAK